MQLLIRLVATALMILFSTVTIANDAPKALDDRKALANNKTLASIDLDPPAVTHIPATENLHGTMPAFSVLATDTQGLASVTLLHRLAGESDYKAVQMHPMAGTDQYIATIDQPAQDAPIEYYFLAVDTGGNRVLSGFPYQPYSMQYSHITLEASTSNAVTKEPMDSTLKWGLLAALTVTVLLASNQSSDGSGPESLPTGTSDISTVPVIVTIPTP